MGKDALDPLRLAKVLEVAPPTADPAAFLSTVLRAHVEHLGLADYVARLRQPPGTAALATEEATMPGRLYHAPLDWLRSVEAALDEPPAVTGPVRERLRAVRELAALRTNVAPEVLHRAWLALDLRMTKNEAPALPAEVRALLEAQAPTVVKLAPVGML